MIELLRMRAETYGPYLAAAIADYAQDNIDAGRWPVEGAVERSRADFDGLLPQGLATPGQHLFEIQPAGSTTTVGYIWIAEVDKDGDRSAFVYDVSVDPAHRRRGYAMAAFKALEPVVQALGLGSIGLHVFAHNPGAQALYARLGYAVTGINMLKRLGAGGD